MLISEENINDEGRLNEAEEEEEKVGAGKKSTGIVNQNFMSIWNVYP